MKQDQTRNIDAMSANSQALIRADGGMGEIGETPPSPITKASPRSTPTDTTTPTNSPTNSSSSASSTASSSSSISSCSLPPSPPALIDDKTPETCQIRNKNNKSNKSNKLAFGKVGLVGREKEIRILRKAVCKQSKIRESLLGSINASNLPESSTSSSASTSTSSAAGLPRDKPGHEHGRGRPDGSVKSVSESSLDSSSSKMQIPTRTLVLIHGQSGSGKSAIIEHLRREILSGHGGNSAATVAAVTPTSTNEPASTTNSARTHAGGTVSRKADGFRGFFVSGKCEIFSRKQGVPYAGIQSAMIDLCRQIESTSSMGSRNAKGATTDGENNENGNPPNRHDHTNHDNSGSSGSSSFEVGINFGKRHKPDMSPLQAHLFDGLTTSETRLLSKVIPNIHSALGANLRGPISRHSISRHSRGTSLSSDASFSTSIYSQSSADVSSIGFRKHTDRLKYVLRRFMQLLCSHCSVVMAIDDLQWADHASLTLLESWLLDNKNTALTIIGSYRSNMLDENQALAATLQSLEDSKRQRSIRIIDMRIRDFDVDEVALYLARLFTGSASSLHYASVAIDAISQSAEVQGLARVVHNKTGGNVLFMQQYLESLAKDSLITCTSNTGTTAMDQIPWSWDVDTINACSLSTGTCGTIIGFMKAKLQYVTSAHRVLSVAACLGTTFSFHNLYVVMRGLSIHSDHSQFFRKIFQLDVFISEKDIARMISDCHREGLIQPARFGPRKRLSNRSFVSIERQQKDAPYARADANGSVVHAGEGAINNNNDSRKHHGMERQYCFVHDNIQEASLMLIPTQDQLSELRYRVGEILLYGMSDGELQDKTFLVANLINTRPDLMPNHHKIDRRMKIVMLNHRAGIQAASSSAFHLASMYFVAAINLLPDDHWKSAFKQSLDLYSSAAESCFVVSDFAKARAYCSAVIKLDCDILHKVRAYHVLIDVGIANAPDKQVQDRSQKRQQQQHQKAVSDDTIDTTNGPSHTPSEICLSLLSQLGCNLPKSSFGRIMYVLKGMVVAKRTTNRLEQDIKDGLCFSDDERHVAVMKTLDKLGLASYLTEPDLIMPVIFKTLKRSLSQGFTAYAAPALAFQGISLGFVMGDFEAGHKCRQMALDVLEASDDRSVDSRTLMYVYAHIHHWKYPLEDAIDPSLEAYRLGMATGDVEAGLWSLCTNLVISFYSGKSLEVLDAELSTSTKVMLDFQQSALYELTLMVWQAVLNLRGDNNGRTTQLIGDACDETTKVYELDHAAKPMHDTIRDINKILLSSFFGEYETGASLMTALGLGLVKTLPSSFQLPVCFFHGALCCFAVAHTSGGAVRDYKYLKTARRCLKKLKEWNRKGCPNYPHHIALLDAEDSFLRGRCHDAEKQYRASIQLAQKRGLVQDEALATERFSIFCARQGDAMQAKEKRDECIRLYKSWGADAKVDLLLHE